MRLLKAEEEVRQPHVCFMYNPNHINMLLPTSALLWREHRSYSHPKKQDQAHRFSQRHSQIKGGLPGMSDSLNYYCHFHWMRQLSLTNKEHLSLRKGQELWHKEGPMLLCMTLSRVCSFSLWSSHCLSQGLLLLVVLALRPLVHKLTLLFLLLQGTGVRLLHHL